MNAVLIPDYDPIYPLATSISLIDQFLSERRSFIPTLSELPAPFRPFAFLAEHISLKYRKINKTRKITKPRNISPSSNVPLLSLPLSAEASASIPLSISQVTSALEPDVPIVPESHSPARDENKSALSATPKTVVGRKD